MTINQDPNLAKYIYYKSIKYSTLAGMYVCIFTGHIRDGEAIKAMLNSEKLHNLYVGHTYVHRYIVFIKKKLL